MTCIFPGVHQARCNSVFLLLFPRIGFIEHTLHASSTVRVLSDAMGWPAL